MSRFSGLPVLIALSGLRVRDDGLSPLAADPVGGLRSGFIDRDVDGDGIPDGQDPRFRPADRPLPVPEAPDGRIPRRNGDPGSTGSSFPAGGSPNPIHRVALPSTAIGRP